jgi:hypothetical protein
MTVLAVIIAAYALMVLLVPGAGAQFNAELRALVPVAFFAHVGGALAALALGPWQLNSRLRNRAVNRHRWIGRAYVVAVLVGGLGGLALAPRSQAGLVTHIGFGLLGVLWLLATLQAYRSIRARDQVRHRMWMIRSYSLTLAAVMLRIYLPLSEVAGIPFNDAYQAIAWACWVPNLIVAEWLVLRQRSVVSPVLLNPTSLECSVPSEAQQPVDLHYERPVLESTNRRW